MSKEEGPPGRVPAPPHPDRRQEPLPWQVRKALEDDPLVPARVENTSVVFGSTRLPERQAAARKLKEIRNAIIADPEDEYLQSRAAVAQSILEKSRYDDEARAFARLIAASGNGPDDCRLTLIQTRRIAPLPVVLVGESFWRAAVNVDFLVAEGVIDAEDRELFWYAETAEDIWQGIQHWHQVNGQPLLNILEG